jgi:LysM repeat protein
MTITPLRAAAILLLALAAIGGTSGCRQRTGSAPVASTSEIVHVVEAGETITSVATAYGVSVTSIIEANGLYDRLLTAGQRLRIPGGKRPLPVEPEPTVADKPAGPAEPDQSWYVPRSAWAQERVVLSRTKPFGGRPTRITVHHSGEHRDAGMNAVDWLRLVDRQHIQGVGKAEPWACIGYHLIIGPDGKIYEGRPLQFQGAHAGWDEVNRLNIGICLIGEFESHRVPVLQREALLAALDRLCADYGISHGNVYGHRHFKVTECPGRYLSQVIEAYADHAPAPVPPVPAREPLPEGATKLSLILGR